MRKLLVIFLLFCFEKNKKNNYCIREKRKKERKKDRKKKNA